MSLRPLERKVMTALLELGGHANFGNLPAYMAVDADITLAMRRFVPHWLKRLLLGRPHGSLRLDVALANLEDMGCVHRVDSGLQDTMLLSRAELRAQRRYSLTPQGRALLYENL